MKILFVCHRFPFPPSRGGKIRPFNVIQHLSRQHEVTVASMARSADEAEDGKGLAEHCHKYLMETVTPVAQGLRMVARLPTPVPSSMGYFYSPRLARRIRAEMRETDFDLIFVHCSSVAQYVSNVRGITKILDFGDMDSQKWLGYSGFFGFPKSQGYWLERIKLQREEIRLAEAFDFCTCTTRAELETLDGYGTGARSGWFPNGVDLEYFTPEERPYDPNNICFVGRMDYFPNQQCMREFCALTWPLIRAARAEATLTIVGASPSQEMKKLGELPGVTVTGTVPDVRPHVRRAAVNVATLKIARGTQNKILESLAMGVPVVASEIAAGGVDVVPGEHMLTADTPREIADQVLRLLNDPAERHRMSRAGRTRMESNHSWDASLRKLDGLIEECLILPPAGGVKTVRVASPAS
jgi:sugar transferase (PEP-CTERM/EpsH1 system associated)